MAVNVKGGALEFDALINDSQFGAVIRKMEMQLQGLTRTAEKEADAVDKLIQKTTQAVAAYVSFAAAKDFVRSIVQVRGEFQQLEVSFTTMLQSKEKADQLMAQAVDLAAKTPFGLKDVGTGAKQLLAYGFSSEEVISTLRRLGDVAAGVSAPLNDIVYLYGTTRTQGRLYAQDLMQFTSRGIPIIAELAKQFGVAESEVKKLVEEGKVGFPEVQKVIMSLTSQGGLFFNLMEEQSKTLTGQISNLQDAWAQMLNNIGKENQGVFSGAISLATELVENYETVIDILKVLAITYGTYRAAIIASSVATAFATSASKGYTVAETLRYQAMLLSERAMKILNVTMLSNPFVAAAAGITALVSAMILFSKEAGDVKTSTELVNEATKDVSQSYRDQEIKVRSLISQIKNQNTTEGQRLKLYQELQKVDAKLVEGIDAKAISYDKLTQNVNAYVQALRDQMALEVNEKSIQASLAQEQALRDLIELRKQTQAEAQKLEKQRSPLAPSNSVTLNGIVTSSSGEQREIDELNAKLKEQEEITLSLVNAGAKKAKETDKNTAASRRTVEVIEAEIKKAKEQRDALSDTSAEYQKQTDIIRKLEQELERITGKQGEKLGFKRESALKKLLEDIADAERAAMRSGLAKEESEIDRINAMYEDLKKRVEALKGDPNLIEQIEALRTIHTGNERTKDQIAVFENYLEQQKDIFERYEEAKKEIGIDAAKQMYTEQTKGFDNYLSFLETEADKFLYTRNTLGGQLRLQAIGSAYTAEEKAKREREAKEQEDLLKKALQVSETFKIRELKINQKYGDMRVALESKFTGEELKNRQAQLDAAQKDELDELESQRTRASEVYKKMNTDIANFTRDQLKDHIKYFEEYLKKAKILPPELEEAIRNYIKMLRDLRSSTGDNASLSRNFETAAQYAGILSDNLLRVADSVRDTNKELADTLTNMSEILSIAESGLGAAAAAFSGDVQGAVSGVFSYYTKVFDFVFAAPKRTAAETKAIIEQFQVNLLKGEQDLNALYRERALQQARINKLKLEGIQAERAELEKQQKAVQEQFAATLAELQKQVAVVGKTGEKYGGVLGIGRKTRAKDITESLAGRSYDDLEKLFMKGQLEGKALELFQLLQKLKQEGADIDAMLLQNAQDLKEMLTGTTADSITDSILEGFKNGKRGARDFADDFQNMMKEALFQSLKFQALEGPLKEFYEQFAANADSDGMLTEEEIRILRERFNSIINDAGKKFDELQSITNVGLTAGTGGGSNNLSGAIRGITAEQADLLAGQFGGLRITALDQLRIAQRNLDTLITIQNHTSNLPLMYKLWQRIESNGIKIN